MSKSKIKRLSKANNGLMVEGDQYKNLSPSFIELGGQPHSKGGTDISYFGNTVEAERGEPVAITNDGSAVVFGKLKLPGTNHTFKSVAKEIAQEEAKNEKLLSKSTELINSNNPFNKFQKYSFNSGMVMGKYASTRQTELNTQKEYLATLQDHMLSNMDDKTEAKWGKTIKYAEGGPVGPSKKKSLAQRHNNPGNIMYVANSSYQKKLGVVPGEPRYENGKLIGYFAKFPSMEAGLEGMKTQLFKSPSYRKLTVEQAAKRWVHGNENAKQPGYSNIPSDLAGKTIANLSPQEQKKVFDTFTMGEDSKKYNWEGVTQNNTTGYTLPEFEVTAPRLQQTIPAPDETLPITPFINVPTPSVPQTGTQPVKPLGDLDIPNKRRLPSLADQNKLSFGQIAPELLLLATERRQFVPGQRYTPQLYTPYQVSFQDQLNQNQSTFSDVARRVGNNPTSLGALAAQKYSADAQVMANEFRTNQEISNQVTNQNTSLLNQAELTNLELQDRQFVRQTQAAANTRANVLGAVNSLSAKYQQNKAENNTIRLYENMFNYRPDENLQMEYVGEDPYFTGGNQQPSPQNQSTRAVYDKNGNLMRTTVTTPSQLKTQQDQYKTESQRRRNILNLF